MGKYKFTLLVTYRSPSSEELQHTSIEFATDSENQKIVRSARIKAAHSKLGELCETISWILFNEAGGIVDQKVLEY